MADKQEIYTGERQSWGNEKMLDWDELGRAFAEEIPDYKYTSAIDAISAYTYEYSRASLVDKLREILLVNSVKSGKTHKAFCAMQFDIVCTTNLEFLLEQGYSVVNKPFFSIIDENQLSISSTGNSVQILKLHGDLNHPNRLIVTEEDYDSFLASSPMFATYLSNLLITRSPLFIGYSLDDSDFRQIWQVIKNRLGNLRRQAYVIKVECSPYEKARFERRGVKVINIPGKQSDYPVILEDVFGELRQYWSDNTLMPTISNDSTQAELALPNDVQNRLCFFSAPYKHLPFYKKYLFPIASKYGFIPISGDDVISAGDNWMAKISALVDKAEFVVIDTNSNSTLTELGMILNQKGLSDNMLIIDSENSNLPYDLQSISVVYRPQNIFDDFDDVDDFDDFDDFVHKVEKWFIHISESMKSVYKEEPKRLLRKKEYRAAVISSITLLEIKLKAKIDASSYPLSEVHLSRF